MMRWLIIISLLFVAGCTRQLYNSQKEQLEAVKNANTFQAYDAFLAKYPETDWTETTLYYRDQLWVDTAIKNSDRASLIEFLRTRPDSEWTERAHYFLENGFNLGIGLGLNDSCDAACHEGEVQVGHANLSPLHREKMKLAEVKKQNTVKAYDGFLAEFPESAHREAIIYERDKLWVEQAIEKKDRAGLTHFIQQQPESKWFDRAHYYLQNKFNVAEFDNTEDCTACHQDDFIKDHNNHRS